MRARLAVLVALALLPVACAPAPTPAPAVASGSCGVNLPADATPEQAIWALVSAESRLVVAQQIEPLMGLWAEDAAITDTQHTAGDATDDQTWRGADAIRLRYLRTVFPSAPGYAQPRELRIEVSGDRAAAQGTTGIGGEVSPAGDRWELALRDGCWVITGLTYNLEP
jgi:hypothetical protein